MSNVAAARGAIEALGESVKSAGYLDRVKLSVKCRVGVHPQLLPDGSVPPDTYQSLHSFISFINETGIVDHVVIHARAAILSGLSSSKNRQVPPLRPEYVERLVEDFAPYLRVTLNGGIGSMQELRRSWIREEGRQHNHKLDGFMAGNDYN